MNAIYYFFKEKFMILTFEIPITALENIPLGYKNRLEERTLLQIYKDGYISQKKAR